MSCGFCHFKANGSQAGDFSEIVGTLRGVRRYSLAKTFGAGIGRSLGSRSSQVNCSSGTNSHLSLNTPTPPYIYLTSPIGFLEHRYEYEVHHLDHFCGFRCPLHCARISCHFRQLAKLRCKFSNTHCASSSLTDAVETMRQHSPHPMQSRCPVYLRGPGIHHEHFLLHRDSMLTIRPATWVLPILQILVADTLNMTSRDSQGCSTTV